MTLYGWSGLPFPETTARSRALEQARALLGSALPEDAALDGLLAELGAGGGTTAVVYRPASHSSGDLLAAVALAKANNGTVELGLGTYTLSAQMLLDSGPVRIRGQGWGSIIQVDAGVSAFLPILVQDSGNDDPITGVVLEDFQLDGNHAGQHDAGLIQINNGVAFSVRRLYVKNGGLGAVYCNGIAASAGAVGGIGSRGVIAECLVEGCTKAGINVTTESVHIVVRDNIVRDNTGDLGQVPGIQVNGGHNALVTGNEVYDNQGDGIVVAASGTSPATPAQYCLVLANHCHGNGYAGIAVRNGEGSGGIFGRTIVALNEVYENGSSSSGHGIHVADVAEVSVHKNVVRKSYFSGIFVNASTRVSVTENDCVDNNTAANTDMAGILVTAANDSVLDRNRCYNSSGITTQKYGITFYTTLSSRVTVRNNDLRGNAVAPLYVQTAPTLVTYSGNIFTDSDLSTQRIPVTAYLGTTLSAKLQAAHDALPAAGGTIDATMMTGAQSFAADVTISKPAVVILLGNCVITTGGYKIQVEDSGHGFRMVGVNPYSFNQALSAGTGGTFFYHNTGNGPAVVIGDGTALLQGAELANFAIHCTDANDHAGVIGLHVKRTKGLIASGLYIACGAAKYNQTCLRFDGAGAADFYNVCTNLIMGGGGKGYHLTGSGVNASNACQFFGGSYSGGASSKGVVIDADGNGNYFYGTDIEGCAVAIELSGAAKNNYFNMRLESNTADATAASGCTDNWIQGSGLALARVTDSDGSNTIIEQNGASSLMGFGRAVKAPAFKVAANQVVGGRKTGWSVATGTATRTAFATSTVTLEELAQRVKALIDDLHNTAGHGLIGT